MSDYLAEALKPFEKLARFWLERDGISDIDDDAECATHIRFADLRAASAALARWESERPAGDAEVEAIRAERDRAQLACQQIAERLTAAEARAEAAEARVKAYEDALDPNQTKRAYIGEVKNEDGRTIAWTATKETMAMIRARAARNLKGAPDGR